MSMQLPEYAIYLPAVNEAYARALATEVPSTRTFPQGFELADMEFWRPGTEKNLWHYPYMLHSVGSYTVGQIPDNAITRRGRTDGLLVGDSGGFQIGNGTMALDGLVQGMSGDDACQAWRGNYDARQWILNWLETYTNYAMTIDMPTWATASSKSASPFHNCTIGQLTELTVENLKFIDTHRKGRTKWLNVIQGVDFEMSKLWWDKVKWFPCNGYSLSSFSARASGLAEFLKIILLMRDEKAFEGERSWLHVLGVSTAPWAIVFSSIQRGLRATSNARLIVSFDSADPFTTLSEYGDCALLPNFGDGRDSWVIRYAKKPESPFDIGSMAPLAFRSAIADKLTLGDLNVVAEQFNPRNFDAFSQAFLMHHNVWTFVETFKTANKLLFEGDRRGVPDEFKVVTDMIEHVFSVEDWDSALAGEASVLANFKR